ncbi:sulfite reductase subunit C [Tepidibacter aestuarii]|uniref:sulfite reductase subunit C n=1 Tax=Tepidibacter aestuarii TaxID=2925782 RepID=UPI00211288F3|nr:sulfite reductase subunit C [Tepidibacter aestuarii]CAH2214508.1 Anaerobic sulfite reductase subunit C [Tepidibacter aestuarii]
MSLDLNVKKMKKNAYRITKHRNTTSLRVRVPGGEISADLLSIVNDIANKYGNGKIHITTRQGFEIMGIPFDKVDEVNLMAKSLIEGLEINAVDPKSGYPAAGTRNVSACIGNKVCPFANYNTTEFAKKIEKAIFPNDHHVKIALTGCPNDCIKAHMQDFGIIGMADVEYDMNRCIGCEACVKNCSKRATGALTTKDGKVKRDSRRCIGCGECALKCPTSAWSRNPEKKYKLVIMGRTGKKNPRIAMPFMEWVDEETIIKVILNTYDYIDEYIDRSLPKEHIGYIVDRTGYPVFKEYALRGTNLGPEVKVAEFIDFGGYKYEKDAFMNYAE